MGKTIVIDDHSYITERSMEELAISRKDRGWPRYAKASLDTFGSCYSYHRSKKKEHDGGREPAKAWLADNGYISPFAGGGEGVTAFVRSVVGEQTFRNKKVRADESHELGSLVEGKCEGFTYYFLPWVTSPSKNADDSRAGTANLGEGPFVKEEHISALVSYLRQLVWKAMESDTAMLSVTDSWTDSKAELTAVSDRFDFVSGDDAFNNVLQMSKRAQAFLSHNMSRTIMFKGPPGTGKTTFARALARELNGRALIVDASALEALRRTGRFILWITAPTVLIFNDIDRAGGSELRHLLNHLETRFKADGRAILTCLTVNDIDQLDPAILRPGRTNEIVEVPEPSPETRRIILDYYLKNYEVVMTTAQIDELMGREANYSPADIQEFVQVAKAVGPDMAITELDRIDQQRVLYAGDACGKWNERSRSPARPRYR